MKKFSLVLALAMAFMLTIGVGVALAAPNTSILDSTSGKTDTTTWGLSNGLDNANKTGEGADINDGSSLNDIIKNVPGQRTHGEYQNDTNSCASCHQTHTASGKKLLFKNGVYNTCAACHDGTLGFYNIYQSSNAGSFGGDPTNSSSVHMATGSMTIAAAPGGNRTSTDTKTWGKDFTCASCHAPHGSYSDRLLHYNPNGIGTTDPTDASGNPTGGKKILNATVAFDSATSKYTAIGADATTIAGPFLYGYTYGKPKLYWTQIRVMDAATGTFSHKYSGDPTKSWNDVLKVNYRGGYFTDPDGLLTGVAVSDIQMDVAPATIVKMNQTALNIPAAQALGLPVSQVDSYKSGVSGFCAACHTDYNSNSAQTETGAFSKAFRHKIVQGLKTGMVGEEANGVPNQNMVCLSCHFAHGTDNTMMKDARDVEGTSTDVNASSALKRYTNMAVCWKCHVDSKAEQLKNNDSLWDQKDAGTGPVY